MVHRIRLSKPWQREATTAGVLWRRKFGRPSGLGDQQTVWVGVEGMLPGGSVALNGEMLGRLPDLGAGGRYDVTRRLRPRNELQILLEGVAMPEESATAPPGEVFIEILEILEIHEIHAD